jgi:hypothetical protein
MYCTTISTGILTLVTLRTPIWDLIWDPDLGPQFGTPIWDPGPDLGP